MSQIRPPNFSPLLRNRTVHQRSAPTTLPEAEALTQRNRAHTQEAGIFPGMSLVGLAVATCFGFVMAWLTRWDNLVIEKPWSNLLSFSAHTVVLSAWVAAWLHAWERALCRRGGYRLAVGVAVCAAVVAESIQYFLPGHRPSVGGLLFNLTGAGGGFWLWARARKVSKF